MFEKFATLIQNIDALKERMRQLAQEEIKPALAEAVVTLRAVFPDEEEVRWDAYTPYFNDGDVCVFHVRGIYLCKEEPEEDYRENEIGCLSSEYSEEQQEVGEEFESVILSAEDALQIAFGDSVTVIVNLKTGQISTEECSHD